MAYIFAQDKQVGLVTFPSPCKYQNVTLYSANHHKFSARCGEINAMSLQTLYRHIGEPYA